MSEASLAAPSAGRTLMHALASFALLRESWVGMIGAGLVGFWCLVAIFASLVAPFTVVMLQINWLLSGVIVVEFFFAYNGFGALLLEAALNQDVFLIEACAIVAVFVAAISQMLGDLGYTYLNPRIRFS